MMPKDRESKPFEWTALGLASVLHDEGFAVEQLSLRLDRLRFRARVVPPLLLAICLTVASIFLYMIVRTVNEENRFDRVLEGLMVVILVLILYAVLYTFQNSLRRISALESELSQSVSVLRELIERVAQFEEFRGLPVAEKFVVELRLRAADKVIVNALRMLGKLPSGARDA